MRGRGTCYSLRSRRTVLNIANTKNKHGVSNARNSQAQGSAHLSDGNGAARLQVGTMVGSLESSGPSSDRVCAVSLWLGNLLKSVQFVPQEFFSEAVSEQIVWTSPRNSVRGFPSADGNSSFSALLLPCVWVERAGPQTSSKHKAQSRVHVYARRESCEQGDLFATFVLVVLWWGFVHVVGFLSVGSHVSLFRGNEGACSGWVPVGAFLQAGVSFCRFRT